MSDVYDDELEQDGETIVSLDEAEFESAREFCQGCGKWMPEGGCPACGEEES